MPLTTRLNVIRDLKLQTERDPRSEKGRYQGLETTLRHISVALWYKRWVVDGYAHQTIGARLLNPEIYAAEISDPVLFQFAVEISDPVQFRILDPIRLSF
jgi:hypothetical protein